MFKNHIKIALRNLFKHKGFSFINVFGLVVGITCCLLIVLYVVDELSYDKYHERSDRIYRVGLHGFINNNLFNGVVSPSPMAQTLVREYPEVTAAVRMQNFGFPVFRYKDKVFSEEHVFWVDASFFDIFTAPLIKGDPKTALVKPRTIVLTRSMARKYFGNEDPMGKTLNADNRRDYLVTGIVEDAPRNSHFHYDFLASLSTYPDSRSPVWVSNNYHTYFLLEEGVLGNTFEPKLEELVRKYVGPQIEAAMGVSLQDFFDSGGEYGYFIQPLTDIHLRSHLDYEIEPNGDIAYVYIFSIIALGILLVACVNFVNLATARASTRAREVGVRKTLGSGRLQLIRQFLAETTLLSLIAVLLALIAVQLLIPFFNNLTGKNISIPYFDNIWTIPLLLGLVLLVGLAAGIYPSLFLASFDPVAVLKTEIPGAHKKSRLRNILVVFQFTISIVLIIGTLIVQRQLNFMQNKNLGFNRDQVVIIKKTDDLSTKLPVFKQELLKNPNVISASNTQRLIGGNFGNSAFKMAGASGEETHLLWTCFADADFVKTYEIEMAAGRYYEENRQPDLQAAVINEAALKDLGLTGDPIGQQVVAIGPTEAQSQAFNIIGVMKDFNFRSLHHRIQPMIVFLSGPRNIGRYVSVRIRPENIRDTLGFLEKTWHEFALNQAFEYEFFDDYFARLYSSEQRTGRIFLYFSILAVIIAGLGLFGLASFVTEQRTKEIGIRKALGATSSRIVILLSRKFAVWVLLGNVIAWPLAYFVLKKWLQRFAYQSGISLLSFLAASIFVLIIAMVIVSVKTLKAAVANPVESLRYE
ncbi:MAG: ABC transporter permease [Candidatus Aminicenantes bacterium]|nr:ABC transporter permease [Candidatus Aminicenantes bacterium]